MRIFSYLCGGYNWTVLIGLSFYFNLAAIICVLLALPLFIGTRRNSILGRSNLAGFALIGLALFLHGGFESVLRSSPVATFSGYVLGWSGGGSALESSVYIYDLGFPPEEEYHFPNAPNRELFLRRSLEHPVPEEFWDSQNKVQMRCAYRIWDRQITNIEAVPVTNPQRVASWRWESKKQGRTWYGLEAICGLLFLYIPILRIRKSMKTRHLDSQSPSHRELPRKFPDKWARSLYALMLIFLLGWVGYVRLSDRLFQHRAEDLLHEIQGLELRKSTWQDASRIRSKYAQYITTDTPCSPAHCDLQMTLDHPWFYLRYPKSESRLGEFLWRATKLPGGRPSFARAMIRVRNGVVWGKDFIAIVAHREDYALIADVTTVRNFRRTGWWTIERYPDLQAGSPSGCEICQKLWIQATPFATSSEMKDAFSFNLACIGSTWRACTDVAQILPIAERLREENRQAEGKRKEATKAQWTADALRTSGRDIPTVAVLEVLDVTTDQSKEGTGEISRARFKVLQLLKGQFAPKLHDVQYSSDSEGIIPKAHQKVIAFVHGRNETPIVAPLTPDNLRAVQAGITEDDIDIPGNR